MSLENEMRRFASIDIGTMKNTLTVSKSGLSAVTNSLVNLDVAGDDTAKALKMATSGLQLMVGLAGIGRTLKGVREAVTTAKTAEAGALTATMAALGPIGWERIALATATMATTSAIMYSTVNHIKLGEFDLSSSAGQTSALKAVQEAIA